MDFFHILNRFSTNFHESLDYSIFMNERGKTMFCFKYPLNENSVLHHLGGGPRVVVSTAAFHARVRGSVPGLGGLKETNNVSSPSTCESQYCGEPP